jgi:alpha-L-rhamnosidase
LAGQFEWSNQLLCRIWQNILWSQWSNLYDVPTDCPQRAQRFACTRDAQLFARTACWNMDMASFFSKWMRDLLYGGPAVGSGPGWADATVVIPWTLYCFYADKRLIEESYGKMVSLVEARRQSASEHLYEVEGFGDHLTLVPSPTKPIGSAYYYYSVNLLAHLARAIGKDQDAAKYDQLSEQIAQAFNRAYLDKEKNLYPGGTQASMILPLYFGLVSADQRKAVEANLVKDIVEREYHVSTGFLGTAYLLPVLSAAGESEVAYRLATQRTSPSWGYMVEKGATTMWEFWMSDLTGASYNHFALGSVGRWFFEVLAGINPDPAQPGFKHIIIRPTPVGDLKWARAEYRSIHGLIRSAWAIKDEVFSLELTVPANTHATVYIPADEPGRVAEGGLPAAQAEGINFSKAEPGWAVYRVDSGNYFFTSRGGGIIRKAQ